MFRSDLDFQYKSCQECVFYNYHIIVINQSKKRQLCKTSSDFN